MSVNIVPGREVDVLLAGRTKYKRMRVHRIRFATNQVDVVDPKNGGIRTVPIEAVRTVHYKQKLRRNE